MKKINIDSTVFLFIYRKYKDYLLPAGVIAVCILLFLLVIIPQFQIYVDTQAQVKVESKKLLILKNNLNLLSSVNESQMDSQFQIASIALPPNKDFEGILNGISIAANKAGVFMGDYNFQVGDINKTALNIKSYPFLQLTLTVNGGIVGVTKFMKELYKTLPLSEVTDVTISSATSQVIVVFYYRPFPALGFNSSLPISLVSQEGVNTINDLSKWNNIFREQPVNIQPVASSSGINANPF